MPADEGFDPDSDDDADSELAECSLWAARMRGSKDSQAQTRELMVALSKGVVERFTSLVEPFYAEISMH